MVLSGSGTCLSVWLHTVVYYTDWRFIPETFLNLGYDLDTFSEVREVS